MSFTALFKKQRQGESFLDADLLLVYILINRRKANNI